MSDETLTESTVSAVIDRAKFAGDGLIPAIIQQWDTREVLMLGYMNAEAMRRTLTEGRVTFWSRSRQEFWRKGDTSGNVQFVRSAALDCDADALLVDVEARVCARVARGPVLFDADEQCIRVAIECS